MMITVKSKIEKGSIRLPKRVKLPDGTQVIVLIYTADRDSLRLERTGTHSDVFRK